MSFETLCGWLKKAQQPLVRVITLSANSAPQTEFFTFVPAVLPKQTAPARYFPTTSPYANSVPPGRFPNQSWEHNRPSSLGEKNLSNNCVLEITRQPYLLLFIRLQLLRHAFADDS